MESTFLAKEKMEQLLVGLIGCGYIAPTHLLAWENITGVKVVAVCDIHIGRAKNLVEKHKHLFIFLY